MPNNRDSSKQRRARENRAQRAALEARRKAANEPKATRASAASGGSKAAPAKASTSDDAPKGFLAKARAERGPRPGDLPVDVDALQGTWFSKRAQVPGGRQVMTAMLLTVVLSVLRAFLPVPDPDFEGPREDAPDISIFDALGPSAFIIIGLPIVAMAIATVFTLHPRRRRIWINCAVFIGLIVVLGGIEYLFSVGYLIYGIWKAKQVEGPMPRRAVAAPATDDDA